VAGANLIADGGMTSLLVAGSYATADLGVDDLAK